MTSPKQLKNIKSQLVVILNRHKILQHVQLMINFCLKQPTVELLLPFLADLSHSLDVFSEHFQEERFANLLMQNFSTLNLVYKFHSLVDESHRDMLKDNLVNYMEILERNLNYHGDGDATDHYYVAQNDLLGTPVAR